jgi:hypothetical protein
MYLGILESLTREAFHSWRFPNRKEIICRAPFHFASRIQASANSDSRLCLVGLELTNTPKNAIPAEVTRIRLQLELLSSQRTSHTLLGPEIMVGAASIFAAIARQSRTVGQRARMLESQ